VKFYIKPSWIRIRKDKTEKKEQWNIYLQRIKIKESLYNKNPVYCTVIGGTIKWNGTSKKYLFAPTNDTSFDYKGLKKIVLFMEVEGKRKKYNIKDGD